MTLILTLASKSAIHQSSDYRLSDWDGHVVETENGTKQLSMAAEHWMARVVFTGVATDGGRYRTLDWLQEESVSTDWKDRPDVFVEKLRKRGMEALRQVARPERRKL